MAPCQGGYQCRKCHLPVPAWRVGRAERARCPAWALVGPGGVVPGSVQWAAQMAPVGPTWKRVHGGRGREAPVQRLPVRRAPGPVPVANTRGAGLQAFRDHVLVSGGGRTLCLGCGRTQTARVRLAGRHCPGVGRPTVALVRALVGRAFDASLLRAGPRARSLAEGLGWVRPPPPPAPD